MNYVQVADGVVVNRAVFDEAMPTDWPDHDSWVQDDEAQIGWSYDGTTFTPPDVPEPEPIVFPPTAEDEVLFNHENRLRTIEGEPPLTMDEFMAVKRGTA